MYVCRGEWRSRLCKLSFVGEELWRKVGNHWPRTHSDDALHLDGYLFWLSSTWRLLLEEWNKIPHRQLHHIHWKQMYWSDVCNSLSCLRGPYNILKILSHLQTTLYFILYKYRNLFLQLFFMFLTSWHPVEDLREVIPLPELWNSVYNLRGCLYGTVLS